MAERPRVRYGQLHFDFTSVEPESKGYIVNFKVSILSPIIP